jgi:circadian clock protein KaiC
MKETTAQQRISTGIKNLDKTVEGGFKKDSINLIEGGPGTGKSIFAMQFIIDGIKNNENGVFITFEEEKENLIDNMSKFGWDLESLEKQRKIAIIEMLPEEIAELLKKKSFALKFEIVKNIHAKRIVIDSISAYSLLFEEGVKKRSALQELFKTLRDFDCTSLLISEREISIDDLSLNSDMIDFQVDSIITLYNIRRGGIRERALEVKKMRGTKNISGIFPMRFFEKGLDIFPDQTLF